MMYQDHDGNIVHHFDIPARHSRLTVTAEALVECAPPTPLPDRLGAGAWARARCADRIAASAGRYLARAPFAQPTPRLDGLRAEMRLDTRRAIRWSRCAALMTRDVRALRVQPEEHARGLADRRGAARRGGGVCQDFAHIFIALARQLGIPSRYVSGYLFQRRRRRTALVRRRHARLGRSVAAGARLGRLRSDQQPRRRASATSASPSAATTPTCRRRAASTRARARCAASSRCRSASPP